MGKKKSIRKILKENNIIIPEHITNVTYQEFENDFYYITYPGVKPKLYAINLYGVVYSLVKNREKILKPSTTKGQYLRYSLRNSTGGDTKYTVSRLVAWEFVGQPTDYQILQVNHADGNVQNNYYKNLEWTTCKENSYHKGIFDLSAFGENHGWSNHKEDVVTDVIKMMDKQLDAPTIARTIIKLYPDRYSNKTKHDYDRIRGLVSKIKNGTSWYKLRNKILGSTTIENITYEKHVGEEVSRVGLHPIFARSGGLVNSGNRN